MTLPETEVDRITQRVYTALNSGLNDALVTVVIEEIDKVHATYQVAESDWRDRGQIIAKLALDNQALRDEVADANEGWRKVTTALGYGDGITEPQIGHDEFIKEVEARFAEAAEWRESQRWRDDCYLAGHPTDEDCHEHDPALRLADANARLAAKRHCRNCGWDVTPEPDGMP